MKESTTKERKPRAKGTVRSSTIMGSKHTLGNTRYEQRLVGCGKANCSKCPHGPYWWAIITLRTGKQIERYVGKHAPEDLQQHIEREEALAAAARQACTTCGQKAGTNTSCPECTQACSEAAQPIKRSNYPRKGSEMCLHCGACGDV